ncbi:hypothetical protein [Micromonospora fluostatini]|uniref:hypothetical protein n=1 Tax=Micromonospora sp. JCM 30529 TaxID=3421643 RepID=UPI003D181791
MSRFYYVHVGKEHEGNLAIGMERSVWGWRSSALDMRDGDARRVAKEMRAGDHLLLGWWGPNPRTSDLEAYLAGQVHRIVVTQVLGALYEDDSPIWPSKPDKPELFPERIRLNVLDVVDEVSGARLGRSAMSALKQSANTKGVPVVGDPLPAEVLAATAPVPGDDGPPGGDTPADQPEKLDAYAWLARRKEQKRLRQLKFGDRRIIRCDLCGSDVPRHLVVLAHIKRRAEANYRERQDPENVMAACLLGCDALFEHGHIHIGTDGRIRPGRVGGPTVTAAVQALTGRLCPAFGPASAKYFAAHVARIDQGSGLILDYHFDDHRHQHGGSGSFGTEFVEPASTVEPRSGGGR